MKEAIPLHFVHIADIVHEGGDLLHQVVHVFFITSFQQSCQRQRRSAPVAVCQQRFQVAVAPRHELRSNLGELVQGSCSGKSDNGLRTRQRNLQRVDRPFKFKTEDLRI